MTCQRCGIGFSEYGVRTSDLLALEQAQVKEKGYCIGCQMIRRCEGIRRERKRGRPRLVFDQGQAGETHDGSEGLGVWQLRFGVEDGLD